MMMTSKVMACLVSAPYRRPRAWFVFARRACPEAGEEVAALAHEEVAPGVADEACARRPGAAFEDLLVAEIRLRIFLICIANEAGIRPEGIRHPFPDIADHLPATERAVAGRERTYVDGAAGAKVEVGPLRRRR